MIFTKEQAELNGKAVSAHLQGKPIEIDGADNDHWTAIWNLDHIATRCHRPAPDPAPPERWSRMEHVPLNAGLQVKGDKARRMILSVTDEGVAIQNEFIRWDELIMWLHTTGERDASGSFIFSECEVIP